MMMAFQDYKEPERQLEDTCYALSSFDTPYSNDNRVASYSGIMFDLFTKGEALEILTLEVDVRLPEVTDFSVEVYTTNGAYLTKINDRNQWTLVANTEAIPTPDKSGIIIPQRAFAKINADARSRISIYIQMKGPWIENRAQALVKTGELAQEGQDFYSYAGVGTSSLFPNNPETTTDPQFSGKVYYQKPKACQDTTKSVISLEFITGSGFDHSSLGPISRAVEEVASEHLLLEEWFVGKASSAGLKMDSTAKTTTAPYNGQVCPWSTCATYASQLTFSHSSGLSEGEISYNVYRYADAIAREVKEKVANDEIAYLGLKSATAGFAFTIRGVEEGFMNSEQERYLASILVSFFTTSIPKTASYATAFYAEFEGDGSRFLRTRRQLDGSITVEGTLYGARAAPFGKEELTVQLRNSLSQDEDFLVQTLRYGSVIPQSDLPDESILSYFDNLQGFSGTFTDEELPDTDWGGMPFDHSTYTGDDIFDSANPDDGNNGGIKDDPKLDGDKIQNVGQKAGGSPMFLIIAGIVGGLLVLGGALYVAYSYYKKQKYKEDLEMYRLKAKVERKKRRASKDSDCEVLKKDALKASQELDEEKGAKTSSSKSDSESAPPESARPRLDSFDEDRGRKRSKRDTASLPDAESLRRAARSKSSERVSSSKHTLLASFMEEESQKKKPGNPKSGAKSLDGTDFRRSVPARSFSDRPNSSKPGSDPDQKLQRSRSSEDLEKIRENLQRRNLSGSPKVERSKASDFRQTRSAHTRSFSGEAGLYGSAAPRRGTRAAVQETPESGRSRSNSPTRRTPARTQSYDPKARSATDPSRASVRGTRSGDLSSMRISRSGDSSMRQSRSGDIRQSSSRGVQAQTADQVRRGRRRDGNSSATPETSSHSRNGGPQRAKSFEAGRPGDRETPRRTKSGPN
eukprot:scaffold3421_cov181-Amphora_coffeaeformis.AAC.29